MTPTLIGRWQTRLVVLATIGLIISFIFALAYNPEGRNDGEPGSLNEDFFIVLVTVLVLGWLWDVFWILLQKLRWDRDWPAAFQVATGVIEGALVWILLTNGALPFIPVEEAPSFGVFLLDYALIWFLSWFWTQSFMRVVSLHWRFFGGRLV